MKKGLVLEGGAMRGMFTAGVTDVMMENNIVFDGAVGVSAGAAFGCNYKSGQIGRAFRYNVRYARDIRYCSVLSLLLTGNLYNARFCYHTVPKKYDVFDLDEFNKSPMEFYVTATDTEKGTTVYKSLGGTADECFEWVRASASLPLVSRPVKLDGLTLLDGGLTDSIPLKFFEGRGYEKNIVVLTQPRNFVKQKSGGTLLMKLLLKKYPKIVEAVENRHIMYNDTLSYIREREKEGAVLVISPPEALPIKRVEHNPAVLKQVYETGRKTAEKNLDKIKEFLSLQS